MEIVEDAFFLRLISFHTVIIAVITQIFRLFYSLKHYLNRSLPTSIILFKHLINWRAGSIISLPDFADE